MSLEVEYVYPATELDDRIRDLNTRRRRVTSVIAAEKRTGGFFPITSQSAPEHTGFLIFTED
ncbi:hypothetical protein ACQPZF_25170 [Actinosynnema sp. CS-041913]|uniref:hypothetical protein n=1 Tax=Actinosynnema sp. CS-041913 TaxID=3239917 RepID=UPI003D91AD1D